MLNKAFFEEMTQSLFELLPMQFRETEQVLKDGFQAVLMQAFSRLDVVSREEFDIQVKVLARTREKLEQLQKQVDEHFKI